MTCTVFSMLAPTAAVTYGAMGGLAALLLAVQLVDFKGSSLRFISRYVNIFAVPLLVWFAFNVIIQVARIITL